MICAFEFGLKTYTHINTLCNLFAYNRINSQFMRSFIRKTKKRKKKKKTRKKKKKTNRRIQTTRKKKFGNYHFSLIVDSFAIKWAKNYWRIPQSHFSRFLSRCPSLSLSSSLALFLSLSLDDLFTCFSMHFRQQGIRWFWSLNIPFSCALHQITQEFISHSFIPNKIFCPISRQLFGKAWKYPDDQIKTIWK